MGMCFSLVIKAVLTATCSSAVLYHALTVNVAWIFRCVQQWRGDTSYKKKKSKIGSLNPDRQRLTFIASVYTHLLSTWRAVCDISVNFLWIIFIAVCILVPRSNDSHNHTTLKTHKICYNVSVLTYKIELVQGIRIFDGEWRI